MDEVRCVCKRHSPDETIHVWRHLCIIVGAVAVTLCKQLGYMLETPSILRYDASRNNPSGADNQQGRLRKQNPQRLHAQISMI